MTIKVRTIRDLSQRFWQHFGDMEVGSPEDIKTGAPIMPVLNAELKSFMAGVVDHCAVMAGEAASADEAAQRLRTYAVQIRRQTARRVEIPPADGMIADPATLSLPPAAAD